MTAPNRTAEMLAALATQHEAERQRRIKEAGVMSPKWYIVQCIRGSDKQAVEAFDRYKIETYYPKTQELRKVPKHAMSASQRRSGITIQRPTTVALFPRYLFTLIDLRNPQYHEVFELAGVGGLVCKGDLPVYMPDAAIASIRSRENRGVVPGKVTMRALFEVGDRVTMTSGPFASFPATVEIGFDIPIEKLEASMRIRIAVDIFGCSTPVELEHWQVAKQV